MYFIFPNQKPVTNKEKTVVTFLQLTLKQYPLALFELLSPCTEVPQHLQSNHQQFTTTNTSLLKL